MPWMTQISQEKVELSAVLRLEKYKTGDTRFLSISRIKDKEEFSILKEIREESLSNITSNTNPQKIFVFIKIN